MARNKSTNVIVVDMDNRAVCCLPIMSVSEHMLPHRRVAMVAFCGDEVVVAHRELVGVSQLAWYDYVYEGDEFIDSALRIQRRVLGDSSPPLEAVGDLRPTAETGYAFTQVFLVRLDQRSVLNLVTQKEKLSWERLTSDMITAYETWSFESYDIAMCLARATKNSEHLERQLSATRFKRLQILGMPPEYTDPVAPTTDQEYSRSLQEIKRLLRLNEHGSWAPDLFRFYECQMPQYPGQYGLEVGQIVLGELEIAQALDRFADLLASRGLSIRICAKLRSGAVVGNEIEKLLRARGMDVERYDVRSICEGYSRARIVATGNERNHLEPRLNLVCETMIGTGTTIGTIASHLRSLGAGSEYSAIALVEQDRPHLYVPDELLTGCTVKGHDWVVGYNTDAILRGVEYCRGFPFLAVLKPRGMGIRERLIMEDFPALRAAHEFAERT